MSFPFAAIGPALSGIGSVLGAFGVGQQNQQANIAQQEQFAQQQQQQQEQFQETMAQNAVSWRVADAQKAGISPLAAMGLSTAGGVVSSPAVDFNPPQRNNLASNLQQMGANASDLAKALTPADKAAAMRQSMQQDQQIKSNDLDLAIKATQLRKLQMQVDAPHFPAVQSQSGGLAGQGSVNVVPDKVVSGDPARPDLTAGAHPDSTRLRGYGGTYISPSDPVITNNPSVTNPFLWRWGIHQYNKWFDDTITNPMRGFFGLKPYVRGSD